MEFYFLQRPKVTQEVKETWNPLLVPLQLNTGGKQAFQKTSRVAFHRSELRSRYLRLLLVVLILLTLIIMGSHFARRALDRKRLGPKKLLKIFTLNWTILRK